MSEPTDPKQKKDPFDGDYIGNIWGWRFSIFGAGLIVFFLLIILYRYYTVDPDTLEGKPLFQVEWPMEEDTTQQREN
jgi:hypothetical protein